MQVEKDSIIDNRYRIIKKLGSGAIGVVYLAEDEQLGRKIALKLLHNWQGSSTDQNTLKRLQREAQSLNLLQHPGIVSVFRFGFVDRDTPFLAMEYIDGKSLRDKLDEEKTLTINELVDIALKIAQALEHSHSRGVIHRDLKPENIMLSKEMNSIQPKLLDFGFCKPDSEKKEDMANSKSNLTSTGIIIGTPAYMSPEQCLGRETTTKSDIYSFACILFEMLTGSVPFLSSSITESIFQHMNESIIDLRPLLKKYSCPEQLYIIIKTCLEKDTENRYANFSEIIQKLTELKSQNCKNRIEPGVIDFYRKQIQSNQTLKTKSKKFSQIASLSLISIFLFLVFIVLTTPGQTFLIQQLFLSLPPGQAIQSFDKFSTSIEKIGGKNSLSKFILGLSELTNNNTLNRKDNLELAYFCFNKLKDSGKKDDAINLAFKYFNKIFNDFVNSQDRGEKFSQEDAEQMKNYAIYLVNNCQKESYWSKLRDLLGKRTHIGKESSQEILSSNATSYPELFLLSAESCLRGKVRYDQELQKLDLFRVLDSIDIFLFEPLWLKFRHLDTKNLDYVLRENKIAQELSIRYKDYYAEVMSHNQLAMIFLEQKQIEKAKSELQLAKDLAKKYKLNISKERYNIKLYCDLYTKFSK